MPTLSGSYQEQNIATIANAITLLDAFLTVQNTRLTALGGAATSITGTITLTVRAEDGAAAEATHRIVTSVNCPSLADLSTLTAALSTFATAVETESSYTTVTEVDIACSVTMSS